jgi:hypothetical protein
MANQSREIFGTLARSFRSAAGRIRPPWQAIRHFGRSSAYQFLDSSPVSKKPDIHSLEASRSTGSRVGHPNSIEKHPGFRGVAGTVSCETPLKDAIHLTWFRLSQSVPDDFNFLIKLAKELLENVSTTTPARAPHEFVITSVSILNIAARQWDDQSPKYITRSLERAFSVSEVCLQAASCSRTSPSIPSAHLAPLRGVAELDTMGPCQKILVEILSNPRNAGTMSKQVVYIRLRDIGVPLVCRLRQSQPPQGSQPIHHFLHATPFKEFVTEMVGVYMTLCVGKRDEPYIHPLMAAVGCQSGFVSANKKRKVTLRKSTGQRQKAITDEDNVLDGVCQPCARLDEFLLSPSSPQDGLAVWVEERPPSGDLPELVIQGDAKAIRHLRERLQHAGQTVSYREIAKYGSESSVVLVVTKRKELVEMERWDGPQGRVKQAWGFLQTLFSPASGQEVSEWEDLAKGVLGEGMWRHIRETLLNQPPAPAHSSQAPVAGSSTGSGKGSKRKRDSP